MFEKNADHSISWNENIYAEIVTAAGVYQSQRIKQKILDPCLALGLQVYVASTHFCKPIGTQWVIWSIAHWLLPLSQDPFSWYLVWTGSNWEQRSIFFLNSAPMGYLTHGYFIVRQAGQPLCYWGSQTNNTNLLDVHWQSGLWLPVWWYFEMLQRTWHWPQGKLCSIMF